MKKLLFATAMVASAAAFADPINAISFERYTPGATFENDLVESNEYYSTSSDKYFYFDGGEGVSNSSMVTNETPSAKRTDCFKDASTTNNYLALDTEGGTFWRSIGNVTRDGDNYTLGTRPVASTGTYLDTLVQFTVTEDDEPTVGSDDKLAIWLGIDTNGVETTTNLMVRAGFYDNNGSLVSTTFTLTGKTIDAGVWYRLTVTALDDLVDQNSEYADSFKLPAFIIKIDGDTMAATTPTMDVTFAQGLQTSTLITSDTVAQLTNGTVFVSMVAGIPGISSTLQGVGFQGTGAVDEIVWTEEDPFLAATVDFTLTWGEGVSAVSYVLSTDTATTNSLTSGTAVQFAPGDGTATIELIPTFTSGYEFDKVTMGETDLGLTFAIPGVTTNATLYAKASGPDYPTYIDTTDATIKAKYDAWKAGVGCDDATASQYQNQFLLNVDESTTVGNTALEITAITKNETAGWDITIGCSIDGVGLTGTAGSAIVCNGYLAVSYTDDLTGTWTTENINVTSVDSTTGTVTVNVNKSDAKFMKVSLKSTAEPQS